MKFSLESLKQWGLALSVAAFNAGTAQATDALSDVNWDQDIVAASCCTDDCCASCGDGCCDCGAACDCGSCCSEGLLGGLIKPSDHCFDDFISPMTNPTFFEDPRNLTEARGIFINHNVPASALGGDVQLLALQLRAALTDRLSFIAVKDGYITSSNPLIHDGWADVAAGLKYVLIRNVQDQRLLTTGVTYTIPSGNPRTQQGLGGGDFHTFLTGGTQLLGYGHWLSAAGLRLPTDRSLGTQMGYWSNHFDYQVFDGWYALTEFNWYHWMSDGTIGVPTIEGGDLFNLGSSAVAGSDVATWAFGGKYKPSGNVELGVAYEIPMTNDRDVLQNRLTVDAILRY